MSWSYLSLCVTCFYSTFDVLALADIGVVAAADFDVAGVVDVVDAVVFT